MKIKHLSHLMLLLLGLFAVTARAEDLDRQFVAPPEAARPWVYWYFMDGNMTREGLTADLEAMKKAGIGGAIFLEVGIGIPRGPVEFMSPQWRELFKHAVTEADRLGIQIALGAGPGWCGSGGPWVKPEQSMQHLVASEARVKGPAHFDAVLPRPQPRKPYFGERTLTPELKKAWQEFYRDVAVLAFPTPAGNARIADIDEKALYYRAPYSSKPGVKPFLPSPAEYPAVPGGEGIDPKQIIDLTGKLGPDGRLVWDAPAGDWTIMRFGRTLTGQTTRPAPAPGLGFESDKFDKAAVDAHFAAFTESLFKTVGPLQHKGRGLTTLHFDSWEMSSQNWSERFREEFKKRRGYDPLPWLPAMLGRVVESNELSERFLWDLRQTAQELVVENHAQRLKELGLRHGLEFSLEPYDLNPCADLTLGGVADVPMCEFWSKGFGFSTEFSCFEAVSLAHTGGHPVVGAEAFTAEGIEAWQQYPGRMKEQGDWALCAGINRFAFHRYQHQPWLDRYPGMTMGPYGVHWERTQTWWEMVPAYHLYLARCQQMLREGLPVADILYLAPEGAPHVFRPPSSAFMEGFPDRRGYNFDGCAPENLIANTKVQDGRIVFPCGMSYRVLVLPRFETMTPALLRKIKELVEAGATVIGAPPCKSPSLVDYAQCDREVKALAAELWGEGTVAERKIGKGRLIFDSGSKEPVVAAQPFPDIYQSYDRTARVLSGMSVPPDFESDGNVRYTHRQIGETELYFIGNRDDRAAAVTCRFRVTGKRPEWWNPLTGEQRELPEFTQAEGRTAVPLRLEAGGSGFVAFRRAATAMNAESRSQETGVRRQNAEHGRDRLKKNFPELKTIATIDGPWAMAFDPRRGGPEKIELKTLEDWSKRPEPGLRYYSGKAIYTTTFDVDQAALGKPQSEMAIGLGDVRVMASVRLNGRDLGTVWCAPWRVKIPAGSVKAGGNKLEITVANLWINRLIGDAALPPEQRIGWTTWNPYKAGAPLQASGLLGPVTLEQ